MLQSLGDRSKRCHIAGKRIVNGLEVSRLVKSKELQTFLCLSTLSGNNTSTRQYTMSELTNQIDPDLRSEREIAGRQLAQMGDILLESYDKEDSSSSICVAMSLAAAGVAAIVILFVAKGKE